MDRLIKRFLTIILVFSMGLTVKAQTSCGVPDLLTFGNTPVNNDILTFWSPVPGAIGYNVQFRIRDIGASYSSSIMTSTNSLLLTNLNVGTNYEFIVQSICVSDSSAFSQSGWFTSPGGSIAIAVTRGPYMTGLSSTSVTIQWRTSVACNSEVTFGTSPGNLSNFISMPSLKTNHVVKINNLQPNTKYYYSVGVIGASLQATADNFFQTAPPDNATTPLRFWVTGDFGTGTSGQQAVRDAFLNYTAGQTINGWLWLGDNAYNYGADQEYQDKVFDVYPSQFKNIPVFPAPGNHDYALSGYQSPASLGTAFPYFDIFDIPTNSGTEKYYSANYGNVHLVALDSYGSYNDFNSDMYRWLEDDLSNNNLQWVIVYFHHPPFSKGSHNSDNSVEMVDMRNNIVPLLESFGVDLVLGGHSHSYERSMFIKGHFGQESTFSNANIVQPGAGPYYKSTRTGDGTIYTVCGVSGKTSSTTTGYPHDAMIYSDVNSMGSLILETTGGSLTGKFLTSTGNILDEFTINKPLIPLSTDNGADLNDAGDFSIYPNPANTVFNIQLKETGQTAEIKIYNLFGQAVYSQSVDLRKSNSVLSVSRDDLNNCSQGIYFVSVTSDGYTKTKSIVLE